MVHRDPSFLIFIVARQGPSDQLIFRWPFPFGYIIIDKLRKHRLEELFYEKRNIIFDHLRALSMLGVVAIHVGDLVMQSGTPWNWLYLLCEVLSRYSVPTFFFISGYGLFYSHPLEKPLEYRSFIKKRFKSIGIPYVVTSLFYMGVASLMARNLAMWHPKYVLFTLFFGLGNYHIYFLVILMWFYLLFPLWRSLMKKMEAMGLYLSLSILFILELFLYRVSAHFWAYPQWVVDTPLLYDLLRYRLNYFPFFYLFVFMMGGVIARHYEAFLTFIRKWKKSWARLLCYLQAATR